MTELERAQMITIENYKRLNKFALKGAILFTGSSLMEQFRVGEIAMSHGYKATIYNRGVGGFTTDDFIENIDTMLFDLEPEKLFINIGTNDLRQYPDGLSWQEKLEKNYGYIMGEISKRLPQTKVYVMAYYPMYEYEGYEGVRTNQTLIEASSIAEELAAKYGFHFINVNQGLTDETGNMKEKYSVDGVHLYMDAYDIVFNNLKGYL